MNTFKSLAAVFAIVGFISVSGCDSYSSNSHSPEKLESQIQKIDDKIDTSWKDFSKNQGKMVCAKGTRISLNPKTKSFTIETAEGLKEFTMRLEEPERYSNIVNVDMETGEQARVFFSPDISIIYYNVNTGEHIPDERCVPEAVAKLTKMKEKLIENQSPESKVAQGW